MFAAPRLFVADKAGGISVTAVRRTPTYVVGSVFYDG